MGNRLRGGPCRRFTSNMRVLWKNRGQYFYPDASVVCGDPQFAEHERKELTLLNPRALFEVLSDSTEGYDRGDKCDFCREMPSLELYVLIDPRKPKVTFLRRGDEGLWIIDFLEGSDATLPLPAIGIDIPLCGAVRERRVQAGRSRVTANRRRKQLTPLVPRSPRNCGLVFAFP